MFTQTLASAKELQEAPDLGLVRAVAQGHRTAFEVLYRRYHPRLMGFTLRFFADREPAEEVVQEAMLIVWKDAGRFREQSQVSTWIFGITYRQAMKALGNKKSVTLTVDGELPDPGVEDADLGNRELRLSLNQALSRLSPEHRAVVELTFFEERSYREIAEILDCPLNTVKTRMFHARERLRQILPRLGWSVS